MAKLTKHCRIPESELIKAANQTRKRFLPKGFDSYEEEEWGFCRSLLPGEFHVLSLFKIQKDVENLRKQKLLEGDPKRARPKSAHPSESDQTEEDVYVNRRF